ncbi:RseA family anti-sigma factor [Lysobacter sp. F60174L2]|uniref:RseA family anti-sigma factor n=1 Tax=Lysobacter sp. F60174L2 TaxID=3459295 RepID=UPI00403DA8AC
MSTTQHHDADRETLSALFDGELQGDSARFALRRLDHDPQWREACGRWQLCGDVLRGQAGAVAPAGFAERVGAALAQEAVAQPATAVARATPVRRRWVGGAALAASVAVAALFVVRPFSQSGDLPSSAPQVAATAGSTAAPVDGEAGATAQFAMQEPAAPISAPNTIPEAPGTEIGLAAAAVAVAEVPRRAGERRSRGQSQRAAVRNSRNQVESPAMAAVASPSTAVAATIDPSPALIQPSSTHPFLPQGEIVSRPWPRAALPDYPTGNTFTAGFSGRPVVAPPAGPTSPFYPFEPLIEPQPESATAPGARQSEGADWPRR